MEMCTLTMAGQQAIAGDARAIAGSRLRPASPAAAPAYAGSQGVVEHLHTSWAKDALAVPTTSTFVVFDGKNRPARQPSERSP